MTARARAGVEEADVVVFVCDGQEGPCASDDEIVSWLRRQHPTKKVVLVVNKCESATQGDVQAAQFWEWGLEPLAISAISGTGTGEMMERILKVRCTARSSTRWTLQWLCIDSPTPRPETSGLHAVRMPVAHP